MRDWLHRIGTGGLAVALLAFAGLAGAQFKIAYIDPLSGGAASAGINSQKHVIFFTDRINAAGGLNGEKIEVLSYDNKVSPQESLIVLKKAIDEGARIIVQGNGSSVAHAITDAVLKYNERNPGKEVLFFNYAAIDPALTNEKCNFWHFRFDADVDMKMAAFGDAMVNDKSIKKVYLINQDYSFGKAVAAAAHRMLAQKRPDVQIVGEELHPLQKVQDFSPYVAKIKASGADTVITGNWSNDMLLLVKAGKDADLKVKWFTYYGGGLGSVPAIGRDGVGTLKQVTEYHNNVSPTLPPEEVEFHKRFTDKSDEMYYWRIRNMFAMLQAAAKKAKSNDPVKLARALEGLQMDTPYGPMQMRADNHQLLQPLFVSTLSDKAKHDVEGTGLGFITDEKIDAAKTALPTTCKMTRPS
ncbi:MAG TPA: branched-chain amino acid ABC transporter substrate-binding protein [Usitatibacter sp.]|jgi:branched-chain amino acid transport system substrate-binding protein|nr:branched-chain amino acid ABC transporter substrate-binding protein [Usitatibacter sp.]